MKAFYIPDLDVWMIPVPGSFVRELREEPAGPVMVRVQGADDDPQMVFSKVEAGTAA